MTAESIVGIVVSSITALTAITAIIISVIQNNRSNKQALFNRRLKIYLTIKWMKSLCQEHKSIIESYLKDIKEGPIFTADLLFVWMTNSAYLEEIQPVINHVLESDWQRKYLLKIEDLKSMCEETKLIFPKKYNNDLADFIFYYEELLVSLYKYQVAYKSISEECHDTKKSFPKNNELEIKCRAGVEKNLSGINSLSLGFDNDCTLQKVAKYIKL